MLGIRNHMLYQCIYNNLKDRDRLQPWLVQRLSSTILHSVLHRVEEPSEIVSSHKFIILDLIASWGMHAKRIIDRYCSLATIAWFLKGLIFHTTYQNSGIY